MKRSEAIPYELTEEDLDSAQPKDIGKMGK